MIKRLTHQEVKTIINICKPKDRAPKYIKHTMTELKGGTETTITVGDINTLFAIMDIKPNRRSKEIENLNSNINQTDLM